MRPTINLATHAHINRRALFATYLCIGVALLVVMVMNLSDWRTSALQLQTLQNRIGELEGQLGMDADATPISKKDFARQLKAVKFSNQVIARDSYRWSFLLSQLEEILPPNVRISSISPNFKEQTILFRGEVRKIKDLQAFLDQLQGSEAFTDVLLLEQARKKVEKNAPASSALIAFGVQVRRGKV